MTTTCKCGNPIPNEVIGATGMVLCASCYENKLNAAVQEFAEKVKANPGSVEIEIERCFFGFPQEIKDSLQTLWKIALNFA